MGKIHLEVEQGRSLVRNMGRAADEIYDSAAMLNSQVGRLSKAWTGGAAEDFVREARRCTNRLQEHADQFEQLAVSLDREIDQWVMADADGMGPLNISGLLVLPGIAGGVAIGGFPGGGSGWGGDDWVGIETISGHTEYFPLNGIERQYYDGYLEGDLTFEEMMAYINKDPFEKDFIKGKITVWESEEAAAHAAVLEGQAATDVGNFNGSLLSAEASAGYKAQIKDGDLQLKGEFDAGAYVGKGSWDAQAGALGLAAVGYVGANVQGESGIVVNPFAGDLGAKGKLEAFAGAKLEGEAELSGEICGVDVSGGVSGGVSYGVGFTAKGEVGMEDWNFSVDLELGATLGLGAEFGINFEVNVQEAATSVVDFGKQAIDFLF